ncbi:hypothetical protein HN484_00410 [Candidatus Woesearchaeota archaeon]|nr:hypothetical protein [Candidatus Woesearchaeota archaeon]
MATLFFITILVVPTVVKLLKLEEEIERRVGVKHFLKNHVQIFKIYGMLFLGIFFGYLLLGHLAQTSYVDEFVSYDTVFGFQAKFLTGNNFTESAIEDFVNRESAGSITNFFNLLQNNVGVAIVCFILSFFYGAGGIYLLVLNASIFSAAIMLVSRFLANSLLEFFQIIGVFAIHLVPEVLGFLIAAIAGGLVSKALVLEQFGSKKFTNVVKDSLILFLISLTLILISSFLEGMVTPGIFLSLF